MATTSRPGSAASPTADSARSLLVTWALSLALGWLGADRIYRGQLGLGMLKLLTCGGLGIWWAIDVALVLTGTVIDERGAPLRGSRSDRRWAAIITGVLVGLGGGAAANAAHEADDLRAEHVVAQDCRAPAGSPRFAEGRGAPASGPDLEATVDTITFSSGRVDVSLTVTSTGTTRRLTPADVVLVAGDGTAMRAHGITSPGVASDGPVTLARGADIPVTATFPDPGDAPISEVRVLDSTGATDPVVICDP